MPDNPMALQLYTVRDQLAADYSRTLRAVAEMGYRAVELTGPGPEGAARRSHGGRPAVRRQRHHRVAGPAQLAADRSEPRRCGRACGEQRD